MIINLAGGTGPMGKVHKPLFEKYGHEVIISGRKTSPSLEEAACDSDMTIVSVPIPNTEEVIQRVGPYCNSMMDLTGLKVFPMRAMLKYTTEDVEIGGLHPMYGDIQNLKGKTVIYCPTDRSEKKCEEIVDCFIREGLIVKTMTAVDHDILSAITQNARVMVLETLGSLLETAGIPALEAYEFSSPPNKIILDLLARQVDEKNDELYSDMLKYNSFTPIVRGFMIEKLISRAENISQNIRSLYGEDFFKECKLRAKQLVEMNR